MMGEDWRPSHEQDRLRWQSWCLVMLVIPLCTVAAANYAVRTWTADTRTRLLISLAFAVAAYLTRGATPAAALAGGILTAAMLLMRAGPDPWPWFHSALPPLVALVLLTLAATKFGWRNKKRLGIAQDPRGRGAAQVVANLGVSGLIGSLAISIFQHPVRSGIPASSTQTALLSSNALCAAMLVAALAEAAADTLSSELGAVLGGKPWLITTRQRVVPGTDGAVSMTGALAGAIGAMIIVLVAAPALRLSSRASGAAGASAMGGLFLDSLLGATVERRGWLNNDAVNFLSTLGAALMAAMVTLLAL